MEFEYFTLTLHRHDSMPHYCKIALNKEMLEKFLTGDESAARGIEWNMLLAVKTLIKEEVEIDKTEL